MINTLFMGRNFVGRSSRLHSGAITFQYFYMQLFLFTNDIDITSYTDDNTLYVTSSKTNLVIKNLEQCSDSLLAWLQNHGVKANADVIFY